MIRSEQQIYSYEPFTRHAFYQAVNRALVQRTIGSLTPAAGRAATVVDLGCGTGAVTHMVVEELGERQIEASIVALDPSADALATARSRLAGSHLDVRFVEGDVSALTGTADVLFLCNTIHLVEDKEATIARIAEAVTPGGLFAFNSTFFRASSRAIDLVKEISPPLQAE